MDKENNGQCCPCQGMGWYFYDDACSPCKEHFCGQLHPETRTLLLDDSRTLKEEERKSVLRWKIAQKKKELQSLKDKEKETESEIDSLEMQLFASAPTMKIGKVVFDKLILDIKGSL